ncbi:MAG: ABC transporter substrate-binding protein [Chloroflexota bacterium]|nr:ABC transporter substrate-binding protein [Chloroflexota bacterium]
MRIVSLVPSATDILAALGLGNAIVGVGRHSGVPPGAERVEVLTAQDGDSARLDGERLIALAPDLVFAGGDTFVGGDANGGPASRGAIRRAVARMPRRPAIYALAPKTVGDALSDVKTVADATGTQVRAHELLIQLRRRIDRVTLRTAGVTHVPRVACLERLDPPRTAGRWVPELIGMAGGHDVLAGSGEPSLQTWDEFAALAPEVLVLLDRLPTATGVACAPPEVASAPGWRALPAVRAGRVFLVDATLLTRAGPRLVDGLETLAGLLHPSLFEDFAPSSTM